MRKGKEIRFDACTFNSIQKAKPLGRDVPVIFHALLAPETVKKTSIRKIGNQK
jgi:hypothetical protein